MNVATDSEPVELVAERLLAEAVEAERRARLAELVEQERERREREAAEAVEAERQARADHEADLARDQRDKALDAVRLALAGLVPAVSAFVAADRRLWDASAAAGRKFKSLEETVGELIVVSLRDGGLKSDTFAFIPTQWANRLRELYPPLVPAVNGTSANCTVCQNEQRDGIDTLLQAGTSVRRVAEIFNLSKSAVDRHQRGHAE